MGAGKRQQWRPYPITYPPGTTIRLRICYALTPERDTEVLLHDGYGLPMRDRWWEQHPGPGGRAPATAPARGLSDEDAARAHRARGAPAATNDEAMMTTRARWTALDELTLRAGVQDGLPLATIAGQLGRTPTAVREKRKRLGLRSSDRHTLSAAAVAQIMGLGCPEDGDELGWPRLAAAHRWTAGAALALRRHRAVGSGRAAGGGRRHPAGADHRWRSCAPTPSSSGPRTRAGCG